MEYAIDIENGNATVEGADLHGYSPPNPSIFVCPVVFCSVQLSAVRPTHKVSHFRTWPERKHHPDCTIDGAEKLVSKARCERLDTRDETNFTPCPVRLVLRDYREIVDVEADVGVDGERTRAANQRNNDEQRPAVGNARRTVGTIRQICKAFLNYPFNRDLELHIPGIDGQIYLSVFKRIVWDKIDRYPLRKIFYSPLHWSRFAVSDDSLEIKIDSGLRDGNKLIDGHKVVVEWRDWSKGRKTILHKELEGGLAEAKEAKDKGNPKVKAWLFFIGNQDENDNRIFRVNDLRLICCLADEFIFHKY